jgi:NAD+ diphosphatase
MARCKVFSMHSDRFPFALPHLDRNALARSERGFLERIRREPSTRIAAVYDRQLAVVPAGGGETGERLRWFIADEFPGFLREHPETLWLYVGRQDGVDVVAIVIPELVEGVSTREWRTGVVWRELRQFVEGGAWSECEVALPAVALANWHVTALFCGRCGGRTQLSQSGWVRVCENCSVEHFPRTDAAVIMAVVDEDDRLLLGNSTKWPRNRFSTLAGFVEPGETLEAAVRREVLEETSVRVSDVAYWESQPWPFPASLMLGYFARAVSHSIVVEEDEIREARWFTRAELRDGAERGSIGLPGATTIARGLIEAWLAGEHRL